MNERIEAILNDYYDGSCLLAVAIQRLKRLHLAMGSSYDQSIYAMVDMGASRDNAISLVQGWEQELCETVQLA